MYILPEMIEMGLKKGQKFPSKDYEIVAMNIALCNPLVTNLDTLIAIVQAVISVPTDKIKSVSLRQIETEFNCPNVWN